MAEGGFDNENPWLDKQLDHDCNDDDGDDNEQEIDRTRSFDPPVRLFTPYHGGEKIEMHTMPRKQSGLPETSFAEDIPLIGDFIHDDDKPGRKDKAMDFF